MAVSPLKLIKDFFGMNLADMKKEYSSNAEPKLTDADKVDLIGGLTPDPATGVPSYTY